jgi:uncharacterized protein
MGHFRKELLTIVLSEDCNMACKYCYSNEFQKKHKRSISLDFAKKGIKDYFDAGNNSIRFFGVGEATLESKKMVDVYNYAVSISKNNLYSELQSNGCFSDELVEWIAENIDMVWISCDGPSDIHDTNRIMKKGYQSSNIVQRNIVKLINSGTKVGIRATISNINVDKQVNMIDYYISLGVTVAFADLVCLPINNTNSYYNIDVKDYVYNFLKAKEYAEKKNFFYSNFLVVNFDEPIQISCRCMKPTPHLMPSGYVSACDMVTDFTNSPLDVFLYGKYNKMSNNIEYFEEKIQLIRSRKATEIPECQKCEIRDYCGGGCAGEAINETGDFFGVKKYLCEATKLLAKNLGTGYNKLYPFLHP